MSLALRRLPHAVSCLCCLPRKHFLSGAGLEKTSSFDNTYLHIQTLCACFLVILACKPSNVVRSLFSCYANPALAYRALLQAGDVAGGSVPSRRAFPPRLMRGGCQRVFLGFRQICCCVFLLHPCGQKHLYCLFLFRPHYLILILLPCYKQPEQFLACL